MPFDSIRNLLTLCIGLGWAVTAWAAATAPVDLIGLPWLQILLAMLLATWGGLAATAHRLVDAVRAQSLFSPVWPSILADILASSSAGFVVYAIGAWRAWDPAAVSVALFFGGYSGTRLLEPMAAVVVERVVETVRSLGGRRAG